ncbi:MAG: hypothetical protein ABUS76_00390 [Candidatus Shikimatogenerans sp. Ttur]|uniref:Uncharacterized protein n=1 Tax=Candidatus Shikimatogenerans sp. Ttur TaxID=3158569 RepID=A0AAU7ZYA6_9FLAO
MNFNNNNLLKIKFNYKYIIFYYNKINLIIKYIINKINYKTFFKKTNNQLLINKFFFLKTLKKMLLLNNNIFILKLYNNNIIIKNIEKTYKKKIIGNYKGKKIKI